MITNVGWWAGLQVGQLGIELLQLMVKYDYRPVTCILLHNARHWTGMTRTKYNAQTH